MRTRLPDEDSSGGRVRRSVRFAVMLAPNEYAAYQTAANSTWLDTAAWARQVLNEAAKAHFTDAPNTPKSVDKSAPAGPLNPTKNRVMRGGERITWAAYYAGRLVDNNGPDGAPRFAAVLRSPHADKLEAHEAYGKAMEECFARNVPVQPGDDHAWSRYLRDNS